MQAVKHSPHQLRKKGIPSLKNGFLKRKDSASRMDGDAGKLVSTCGLDTFQQPSTNCPTMTTGRRTQCNISVVQPGIKRQAHRCTQLRITVQPWSPVELLQ
eukprot:1154164-Pelagomonas_calceolata.AAC.2